MEDAKKSDLNAMNDITTEVTYSGTRENGAVYFSIQLEMYGSGQWKPFQKLTELLGEEIAIIVVLKKQLLVFIHTIQQQVQEVWDFAQFCIYNYFSSGGCKKFCVKNKS